MKHTQRCHGDKQIHCKCFQKKGSVLQREEKQGFPSLENTDVNIRVTLYINIKNK